MHVAEVDDQSQQEHRPRLRAEPEKVGRNEDVGLSPEVGVPTAPRLRTCFMTDARQACLIEACQAATSSRTRSTRSRAQILQACRDNAQYVGALLSWQGFHTQAASVVEEAKDTSAAVREL